MSNHNLQTRKEKIDALLSRVSEGVAGVFDSKNYRDYLTTMSKFHNYSARNCILIHLQNPEATTVAGFEAWKKFDRNIKRGEHGIQVIACAVKDTVINTPVMDGSGNPVLGENGKQSYSQHTESKPYFFPAHVFDVSQTHGKDLPELTPELKGSVENFGAMMFALNSVSPYPIGYEDMKGKTKGYTDHAQNRIFLKSGMDQAQTLKTAVHEITHADLHGAKAKGAAKSEKEVQAESVAFVVCSHYGLDTSQYSFPYIAAWSRGREVSELTGSLTVIQKQANDLIYRIDAGLEQLQKEKTRQQAQTGKPAAGQSLETKNEPRGDGQQKPRDSMANIMAAAKAKADTQNAEKQPQQTQKHKKEERAAS